MKKLGDRLKIARKNARYTQSGLAHTIGVSRSYIAGIEAGRYNPSVRVLVALATACNVPVDFFVQE